LSLQVLSPGTPNSIVYTSRLRQSVSKRAAINWFTSRCHDSFVSPCLSIHVYRRNDPRRRANPLTQFICSPRDLSHRDVRLGSRWPSAGSAMPVFGAGAIGLRPIHSHKETSNSMSNWSPAQILQWRGWLSAAIPWSAGLCHVGLHGNLVRLSRISTVAPCTRATIPPADHSTRPLPSGRRWPQC